MKSIIKKFSLTAILFAAVFLFSSAVWAADGKGAIAARRGDAFYVEVDGEGLSGDPWFVFKGREFPLRRDKGIWKGLAAVDREVSSGDSEIEIFHGSREKPVRYEKRPIRVGDRTFPEQRLTVDEKKVTLSKADLERALREKELISKVIGLRSPDIGWPSGWEKPVEGIESSPFGLERYYNGNKGSYHSGIDIASPAGTPVKASSGGRVALTGDFFYTGNTVFVDHGYGVITGYFHMSEIGVKDGEKIGEGSIVGKVGSTGRSTGAHLHWSLYVCGIKADPHSLLELYKTP